MNIKNIHQELCLLANPARAKIYAKFFKTGKGDYGEGDRFLGIQVPSLRIIARSFNYLSPQDVIRLLHSPFHEKRMIALLIFVHQYQKGDAVLRKKIYDLYLANTSHINNWDLVDVTAPHIIGSYLLSRSRRPLYRLAKSSSLWERRIAIVATITFIRENDFADTLAIADILLHDRHDLIQKAVGWMLREVYKKSPPSLTKFLDKRAAHMPRTMLRYAIERMSKKAKHSFMHQS